MTTVGTQASTSGARLAPGFVLGDYRLGQPMFGVRIADAYHAQGPAGAATIYVIHAPIAANAAVRDHIIAGTRVAAALPEHKHRVRTLAAGLTGDILWIATEEVEGSLVRDMIAKKRTGLGTRATGNLIAGIADALADAHHGALADESVAVNRTGRVRVTDLALGPGTAAAVVAGLIPPNDSIAPEILAGGAPSAAADVYGVGALVYEALVGVRLDRNDPRRPSDAVDGLNTQIDDIVGRACHRDPDKRFGRVDVLGEVVAEALTKGGAVMTSAVPLIDAGETLDQIAHAPARPSLASEIAAGSLAGGTAAPAAPATVDHALAAALADTTEKWLIQKGRLDYGPFSLAEVIEQIEKGEIVAGNIIMDKDSGARVDVDAHPLLGAMVDAAKQRMDEQRRAQAEVAVQSRDKKRGVLLYAVIALGVIGLGIGVYFVVGLLGESTHEKVAGVEGPERSELKLKVSAPKAPPRRARRTHGRRGVAGNYSRGKEDLSLDMSDGDDGGGESLDMGRVYQTYSRYGGQLGGCLASTGSRSANIYINIDGPSGRVQFVKINGKQSGTLYACLNRVLRGMKFPSVSGKRTRAEFDISM